MNARIKIGFRINFYNSPASGGIYRFEDERKAKFCHTFCNIRSVKRNLTELGGSDAVLFIFGLHQKLVGSYFGGFKRKTA